MFKMIICDDELTLRNGLKKLVERTGLPFDICGLAVNGPEALNLIKTHRPSIALMDINMPGLSGLDVIEETRKLAIPVKFIIISGYDEFSYAQRACHLGAADYLLKPINKEELIEILEKMIHKLEKEEQSIPAETMAEVGQETQAGRILSYVRHHFMEGDMSLIRVADEFHLSQSYVTRLIKQESGKTFTELLNEYRIDHAKQLLVCQKNMKLWAVAEACGFAGQHYFCRVFKQLTGMTPAEYRKTE